MQDSASFRVTRLLQEGGDRAASELLPLVYDQLRSIAQQRMQDERTGHTLQATALVHEAYLRLVGDRELQWNSRAHFFVAAAEAMRRILIEHARARGRVKRGGDGQGRPANRVPLSIVDLAADESSDEILVLEEAFCRLEKEDPEAAQVVRLRLYAGLSVDETAAALGISPSGVDREWAYARAWLHKAISEAR